MALMNAAELLEVYQRRALPSFDVGGGCVDFVEASFMAAEKAQSGMYLSSTPSTVENYLGYDGYVQIIQMIAKKYPSVNYAIHLDHAKEVRYVENALLAGYSSVMYDGSHLNLSENIANTRVVIARAQTVGATVECELGTIGGKEDEIEGMGSCLPSFDEVMDFVDKTGACLTAPAVGTVHGHFKGEPSLKWDLINSLKDANGNFVLHGCTGLDSESIQKVSQAGFVKFNFATALREAFKDGMLNHIQDHPEDIKPFAYLKGGRLKLTNYMSEIYKLLELSK